MSGKDTLGFLTESALIPRRATVINSVSGRSLVELRAAVATAAAGLRSAAPDARHTDGEKAVRKRGRDGIFDTIAARRASSNANPGVAARAAADARAGDDDAARLRAASSSLERKAAIYEAMASTGDANSLTEADLSALAPSLRAAIGASARRPPPTSVGTHGVLSRHSSHSYHTTSLNEAGALDDSAVLIDFRAKRRVEGDREPSIRRDREPSQGRDVAGVVSAGGHLRGENSAASEESSDSSDVGPRVTAQLHSRVANPAAASSVVGEPFSEESSRSAARALLSSVVGSDSSGHRDGGGAVRSAPLDDDGRSTGPSERLRRNLAALSPAVLASPTLLMLTLQREDAMEVQSLAEKLRRASRNAAATMLQAALSSTTAASAAVQQLLANGMP